MAAVFVVANLTMLVVMLYGATAIAALTSALVARALRVRVGSVAIGYGRLILPRRTIGGIEVTVRLFPCLSAIGVLPGRAQSWIVLRSWITLASIPVTSLALYLLVGPGSTFKSWEGLFVRDCASGACRLALFLGLVPIPGTITWALVTTPFRSRVIRETMLSYPYLQQAMKLAGTDVRGALDQLEAGLQVVPDGLVLLIMRAGLTNQIKEYQLARERTTAVLARSDVPAQLRPALQNELAWACAMLGDAKAADEPSASALAAICDKPHVWNTRGVVLVELGRIDEGCDMLQKTLAWRTEPKQRAVDAIWLAIGEARRGNEGKAREHLELALELDPGVDVRRTCEGCDRGN